MPRLFMVSGVTLPEGSSDKKDWLASRANPTMELYGIYR